MRSNLETAKNIISLIIFLPILIIFFFLRIFCKINIVEIETRAIGHYSYPIEIFICEIKNNIHEKKLYFAFRNKVIANNFLYEKVKKNFIIFPRFILQPIFKFYNHVYIYPLIGKYYLSDFRHWTRNFRSSTPSQEIDIHGVLEKTPPLINFSEIEKKKGFSKLQKINIHKNDKFICIHPRTPDYYLKNKIINKLNYQLRDSRKFNFDKTSNYLNEKKVKCVLLGEFRRNFTINKNIIYYNNSDIKSDFLDIFLLSRCKYLIGDSSGMSMAPMIFRKKSLYINVSELHTMYTLDSIYKPIIILKKFISLKTGEHIPYPLVLEKNLSKISHINKLNDLGYDVVENSEEEVFEAVKEMDYFIDKNEYLNFDISLEKKFNELLLKANGQILHKSKISNYFLKKNSFLLE